MNPEKILTELNTEPEDLMQYARRLLYLLPEDTDENELKKYLMFSEGAASGNINVAKNNAHEKQKLLKNLKQSLSLQQSVENVANWAKLEYRLHLIEVIVVGIVIGVAAIVVPIFWGK